MAFIKPLAPDGLPPYPWPGTTASNIDPRNKTSRSMPAIQFRMQSRRQAPRITKQYIHGPRLGRQVLPADPRLDIRANAENNVRAEWMEQGIWQHHWGPAWLAAPVHPGINDVSRGEGPGPKPCGYWAHDERAAAPPPSPKPRRLFGPPPNPPSPSPSPDPESQGPRPLARDREASRPNHQFAYQVAKEREWLDFEIRGRRGSVEDVDLAMLARQSVVRFWKETGIWDDDWEHEPGTVWTHEPRPAEPNAPPTPPADDEPPSYEEATRPRGSKRKAEATPALRRSPRIAAQNREPRRSKRLRRI